MWSRYPPVATLDPKYVSPDPSFRGLCKNGTPSVLAYGFAFTWERLIQYGYHHGIIKTPRPIIPLLDVLLRGIRNRIQDLSGTSSRPVARNVIHDSEKYCIVLAIYDNYTLADDSGVRKGDQKAVLNTIRRELQVPEEEEPLRYFDPEYLYGPYGN